MAVVTLFPTALRGSTTSALTVPNGASRHLRFKMQSPDFPSNAALTFDIFAEQSFDSGQSFTEWPDIETHSVGGQAGLPIGKGGAIYDGLPTWAVQFDGVGRQLRFTITVNTPFRWGLTAEDLA